MIIVKTMLLLYYEFFKTGLFAIGGGLATIPFLREIAKSYNWFTTDLLSDMIAISESTPGAIGVNMATYSGFSAGHSIGGIPIGIIGSFISTIGLVTPSIIIILLVSKAYRKFRSNPLVVNAFYTIRPAVLGMIAAVALTLIEAALISGEFTTFTAVGDILNIKAIILFAILLILMNIKKIKGLHPIFFIIIAGVCGAVFGM